MRISCQILAYQGRTCKEIAGPLLLLTPIWLPRDKPSEAIFPRQSLRDAGEEIPDQDALPCFGYWRYLETDRENQDCDLRLSQQQPLPPLFWFTALPQRQSWMRNAQFLLGKECAWCMGSPV